VAYKSKNVASNVTFTPTTLSNWTGSVDPGDVDDALDQLASRLTSVESSNVFGSNFVVATSEALDTLTGVADTFFTKVTLSTGSVPAGTYRIGWYYEWMYTDTATDFTGQVIHDDVTVIGFHSEEPFKSEPDQSYPVSGFGYVTYGSTGSHTFKIQYSTDISTETASISKARLEFWRVS
jgi:Ca2+-binding RTX toxin-like protein